MTKQTCKAQLLKDITSERTKLEKTLAHLSVTDMLQSGVIENWSIKDMLAHLAAWEKLFLDWYRAGVQGSTFAIPPVGRSRTAIDALNKTIYERNQSRSLDEIAADFHRVHAELLSLIQNISEDDLFTRGRYAWTGDLTLADYLAGNTCNHFAWANDRIKLWIKNRAS